MNITSIFQQYFLLPSNDEGYLLFSSNNVIWYFKNCYLIMLSAYLYQWLICVGWMDTKFKKSIIDGDWFQTDSRLMVHQVANTFQASFNVERYLLIKAD